MTVNAGTVAVLRLVCPALAGDTAQPVAVYSRSSKAMSPLVPEPLIASNTIKKGDWELRLTDPKSQDLPWSPDNDHISTSDVPVKEVAEILISGTSVRMKCFYTVE